MAVYKDPSSKLWYCKYYVREWNGKSRSTTKRGFRTKREAMEFEQTNRLKQESSLSMPFKAFVEIYRSDMNNRIRENTWLTKEHIINDKILPYFGEMPLEEISTRDVMKWQNIMLSQRGSSGKRYSTTYLKTIHNQISAIFNHAVRFYDLKSNPAAKVGNMGKGKTAEMLFWTKEEYQAFSEAIMDKPLSYYAFEVLYWCGIRLDELLALTRNDFNLEKKTLSITKSMQRIKRRDVITDPKTEKSIRTIVMPDFLCEEMQEFFDSLYGITGKDRVFVCTKSYLHREMTRGCKASGVKEIRIHDLRHSHVSLLINMGYSAVAIGNRVGHESVDITFRYAHMFPTEQIDMANRLDAERGDN